MKHYLIGLCAFIAYGTFLHGAEFITITVPANSSTVTGVPLVISGASSQVDATVRVKITTPAVIAAIIVFATTDDSGNWSTTATVPDGTYTMMVDLVKAGFLAKATNSFTVANPPTIAITNLINGEIVGINPVTISGNASLPSTTVNVSVDGELAGTTTTTSAGNWSTAPLLTTNGVHTLLAQLIVSGSPVASNSIVVNAAIPVIFPIGASQIRIVDGNILTSGSGSGPGYTYVVSGSSATVTFSSAFSVTPAVVATGQRVSGSSTVTLASVSTSAITLGFSTGTQRIHFTASALA